MIARSPESDALLRLLLTERGYVNGAVFDEVRRQATPDQDLLTALKQRRVITAKQAEAATRMYTKQLEAFWPSTTAEQTATGGAAANVDAAPLGERATTVAWEAFPAGEAATALVQDPPASEEGARDALAATAATEELACRHCQSVCEAGESFCFHCGHRLEPASPTTESALAVPEPALAVPEPALAAHAAHSTWPPPDNGYAPPPPQGYPYPEPWGYPAGPVQGFSPAPATPMYWGASPQGFAPNPPSPTSWEAPPPAYPSGVPFAPSPMRGHAPGWAGSPRRFAQQGRHVSRYGEVPHALAMRMLWARIALGVAAGFSFLGGFVLFALAEEMGGVTPDEASAMGLIMLLVSWLLAGCYTGLLFWSLRKPLPAFVLALVIYGVVQVLNFAFDPEMMLNVVALGTAGAILVALIFGVQAAIEVREKGYRLPRS